MMLLGMVPAMPGRGFRFISWIRMRIAATRRWHFRCVGPLRAMAFITVRRRTSRRPRACVELASRIAVVVVIPRSLPRHGSVEPSRGSRRSTTWTKSFGLVDLLVGPGSYDVFTVLPTGRSNLAALWRHELVRESLQIFPFPCVMPKASLQRNLSPIRGTNRGTTRRKRPVDERRIATGARWNTRLSRSSHHFVSWVSPLYITLPDRGELSSVHSPFSNTKTVSFHRMQLISGRHDLVMITPPSQRLVSLKRFLSSTAMMRG